MITAPLLTCNLKSRIHEHVYATDLRPVGAVVYASPTDLELAWLWSRIPRRGAYARLFADDEQDETLDKSEVKDELLYDMVGSLQFEHIAHWTFPTDQHIGLQELASFSMIVRRLAKDRRNWGQRVVFLIDARVI